MYSNALDEADIKFYDDFLSSHLDDGEISQWSNEFNPNLDLDPELDLIHEDIGAIIDGSDQKYSPNSSDSGNHSPSTISSDCGFSSSDPWASTQYDNGTYSEDHSHSTIQSSPNKRSVFINGNLNNNYITPKLTPVTVSVNHVNTTAYKSPPTYYTNALPSSSNSTVVVARPVETITLVPASIASSGQFIISSAPTLKLAPIQKSVTQLQRPPTTTPFVQNVENADMDDDEYRKKMEDRRLRNRAAAQQSRNKKRQQMDTMKEQLDDCEKKCARLQQENDALKGRIAELEKENELLLISQGGAGVLKHKKARAMAGVCLAMCALVFTFSGSLPARDVSYGTTDLQLSNALAMKDSPEYLYVSRHGRSLAEVQDYDPISDPPEQVADNKTILICPPSFLNASEKIRLNNVLDKWVDRHDQMDFVELRQGMSPFLIHNNPKADRRAPKQLSNSTGVLKVSAEDRRKNRLEKRNLKSEKEKLNKRTILGRTIKLDELNDTLNKQSDKSYELAVRSESDARLIEQLAAAIKQRDDVLYVVTMKDYFLMPMIHRNATSSPKLSIVIPALHAGNSSSPNQIQMLQIDCVVSSTRTIDLPDTLVSLFNRSGQN